MIERIEDVPDGVVGLRGSGEISADDYKAVLEPALDAAAASGEVRLLYVLEPGFSMTAGATIQDARTGLEIGLGHHSAWRRAAVVTDAEWIAKAIQGFAWMMPGEVRAFGMGELDSAREWVAG